jgi:hypothetical protein
MESGHCLVSCYLLQYARRNGKVMLMGWFRRVLGIGPAKGTGDQAIIITLDGMSLPDEVYEQYDTATLEEKLEEALSGLGECDGAEHGERNTQIFLYGPNAEAMFRAVEPTLLGYPLAASARVILRAGPPGSPQREVRLP